LCLIFDEENSLILLGMKKRGFGVGKYNGFGGHVDPGESFEQACSRELLEECGLSYSLTKENKVGEFDFYFPHKPEFDQTVHVYLIKNIHGDPIESEEMAFRWFPVGEIPYSQMWDDDKYWVPHVIHGKKLRATFVFKNENNENIVAKKLIKEVSYF